MLKMEEAETEEHGWVVLYIQSRLRSSHGRKKGAERGRESDGGLTMVCGLGLALWKHGEWEACLWGTHLHGFQGMLGPANKRIKCAACRRERVVCVFLQEKKNTRSSSNAKHTE